MTDKCACCGEPATQTRSMGELIDNYAKMVEEFDGDDYAFLLEYGRILCEMSGDLVMRAMEKDKYAAGQWQSMDTVPEDEEDVLVWFASDTAPVVAYRHDGEWNFWPDDDSGQLDEERITAWAHITPPDVGAGYSMKSRAECDERAKRYIKKLCNP